MYVGGWGYLGPKRVPMAKGAFLFDSNFFKLPNKVLGIRSVQSELFRRHTSLLDSWTHLKYLFYIMPLF